jgi:hypothetical protein
MGDRRIYETVSQVTRPQRLAGAVCFGHSNEKPGGLSRADREYPFKTNGFC